MRNFPTLAPAVPQRGRPIWSLGAVLLAGAAIAMLAGCATKTAGRSDTIEPVRNFNAQKYMGKWHEIARIDHRFQEGLVQSTAQYSLNDDGSVKVINRGFDPKTKQWKQVEGKAKFVGDPTVAALKVSFFGPFYGGYNVVELDPDYQVAMVIGESTDYFWILAREPRLPTETLNRLLSKAEALGVDLSRVRQD